MSCRGTTRGGYFRLTGNAYDEAAAVKRAKPEGVAAFLEAAGMCAPSRSSPGDMGCLRRLVLALAVGGLWLNCSVCVDCAECVRLFLVGHDACHGSSLPQELNLSSAALPSCRPLTRIQLVGLGTT